MSYLGALTLRLAAGAMHLPAETRQRHADYLAAAQNPEGGFGGRDNTSDLYYTGFALRGLALVGELNEAVAQRAAEYLRSFLDESLPGMDYLSLVYAAVLLEATHAIDVFGDAGKDRAAHVAGVLRPLRRPDAGYAKSPRSPQSSTYFTFLAASCLQLVGGPPGDVGPTVNLIRSRQREDGGFVELGPLRHSGTNPTAAAVGLLRLLDSMDEPTRHAAAGFLSTMQGIEGGFRANTRIPVADLLSTFTALVALADLDALESIDVAAVRRYVASMEQVEGGFVGGAWDDTADVEYTFYGLGALALLTGIGS